MGIDIHALQLLRWASFKSNGLGEVATIGRQGVHIPPGELGKTIPIPADYQYPQYCEDLLVKAFGAERVDSFDNSDFEGCTYVADLGKPLVPPRQYDTIIDAGCLEHIFDVPQALRNVSSLCAAGGQILHCLPANNYCGHGFWQFSPELFFSLYSAANGYSETQVFVVSTDDEKVWYEVIPSSNGRRVVIWSDSSLYVLCRTVKQGDFSHDNVQQSDYVFLWNKAAEEAAPQWVPPPSSHLRTALKQNRFIRFLYRSVAVGMGLKSDGLSDRNPFLIKRYVSELTGS
jgi:Methyltransferase domain